MKNIKTIILFMVVAMCISLIFVPSISNAATTTQVNSEDQLINAINNASETDIIQLSTNIELTRPIEIVDKTITINGNGHTISRNANNWTPNQSNATLITAGIDSKVTLMNLNLTNSQKYGAQAYNGGYLIVDNVTISNCGFGGILVNAGTLEVRNLSLNRNGQDSNNGIEIAKSSTISESDNQPTVIMNGTLSSTEQENVIFIAINDALAEFEIENTPNTVNKILSEGNRVVITDKNNNVIYESNTSNQIEIGGETFVENIVITIHLMQKNTSFTIQPGTTLTQAQVLEKINLQDLGLTGYNIDGFFTDENYKTPFDFSKPFTNNTSLFAKLSAIKTPDKDKSPKTGVEDYIEIAILVVILSSLGILALKRRKEF